MKRFLQCLAGGVLIPIVWFGVAALVAGGLKLRPSDGLMSALIYPVAFPLKILSPYYPQSDSPDPNAPQIRSLLDLTAILMDVIVYSLLTYVVLRWHDHRKLKRTAIRRVV